MQKKNIDNNQKHYGWSANKNSLAIYMHMRKNPITEITTCSDIHSLLSPAAAVY